MLGMVVFSPSFLPPFPHQILVLRLVGKEHCQHLNLSLGLMSLKSLSPSLQRQSAQWLRELRRHLPWTRPSPHAGDWACQCTCAQARTSLFMPSDTWFFLAVKKDSSPFVSVPSD